MSGPAPPVPFATVRPGLRIPPLHVDVRDSTNRRLCESSGIAPDADDVSLALAGNLDIGAAFVLLPRNVLHVRQRIERVGAVRVGDRLDVHGAVSAVGARRGRAYVGVAATISRAGERVWSAEAELCVPAMGIEGLPALERAALEVPAAATVVASRSWRFTLADMASFSGRGNFHSDREVAAAFGYPAPLAQGMHVAAIGFGVLDDFRPGWTAGAVVELRFVGETPEGCEVVVDVLADPDDQDRLWLRATRADGVPVLVGEAQVGAPA